MAVDGDHAPVDEVPAFREVLERGIELVRIGGRTTGWAGRLLTAGRVRTETIANRGSTGSL